MLRGLTDCFIYLDDILVFSRSAVEHESDLRKVFERLRQYSLIINVLKSEFGIDSLEFLGHQVDQHGIRPVSLRVQVKITHNHRPQRNCGNFWASSIPPFHSSCFYLAATAQSALWETRGKHVYTMNECCRMCF